MCDYFIPRTRVYRGYYGLIIDALYIKKNWHIILILGIEVGIGER